MFWQKHLRSERTVALWGFYYSRKKLGCLEYCFSSSHRILSGCLLDRRQSQHMTRKGKLNENTNQQKLQPKNINNGLHGKSIHYSPITKQEQSTSTIQRQHERSHAALSRLRQEDQKLWAACTTEQDSGHKRSCSHGGEEKGKAESFVYIAIVSPVSQERCSVSWFTKKSVSKYGASHPLGGQQKNKY